MPIAEFQAHAKGSPELAYHRCGELKKYTDIPEFCTFTDQSLHTGLALEKQKELIHGYYACISYLDAQVGELLDTLDSLGTLHNTIIVLWGTMVGIWAIMICGISIRTLRMRQKCH